MTVLKVIAVILIAIGLIVLVSGGFTYLKSAKEFNIGPVELLVNQRETFYIPVWVGVIGILSGTVLLLVSMRKKFK